MLTQQSNMAGNQKNVSFQVRKFLRVKVYRIAGGSEFAELERRFGSEAASGQPAILAS